MLLARCDRPSGQAGGDSSEVDIEKVRTEQSSFAATLMDSGVLVHWIDRPCGAPTQIFIRDIGAVIGDRFIVFSPRLEREAEVKAMRDFAEKVDAHVLQVNRGLLEGGDLLLDGEVMYVGLGGATNQEGLEWLRKRFSHDLNIVPIVFSPQYGHLDMVFNIIGRGALVYAPALSRDTLREVSSRHDVEEVTPIEQLALGTNVLALSPRTVVSDQRQRRINALLRKQGYSVVELGCRETSKMRGLFRCMCCPLERDTTPEPE